MTQLSPPYLQQALIEELLGALITVTMEGTILTWNTMAETLFGYTVAEAVGRSIFDTIVPPDLVEEKREWLMGAAQAGPAAYECIRRRKDGRQVHVEVAVRTVCDPDGKDMRPRPSVNGRGLSARRKDGTEFPVEISLSPLTVDSGNLTIAAVRDISERLRLEEIRREVGERKLAQEALALQAAELARSNAELEQFAYVASHDLQEPLRMVASYTQLLARRYQGTLDADVDESIAHTVEGVTRMQQMISDLLSYSQVGTEMKPSVPVDCEAVLLRVLAQLKTSLERSGAVVTHEALPTVMVDGTQIVERNGGRIWIESVPGQGAPFHVTLHAARATPPGDAR